MKQSMKTLIAEFYKYPVTEQTKNDFKDFIIAKETYKRDPSSDNRYEMKSLFDKVFTDVKGEKSTHIISQQELDLLIQIIYEVIDE